MRTLPRPTSRRASQHENPESLRYDEKRNPMTAHFTILHHHCTEPAREPGNDHVAATEPGTPISDRSCSSALLW